MPPTTPIKTTAKTPTSQASWFGALDSLGADDVAALPPDLSASARPQEAPESSYEGGWPAFDSLNDSRFLSRQAHRIVGAGQTAFERIYQAFIGARATLGLALMATLLIGVVFGVPVPWVVMALSASYALLTSSLWLWRRWWPRSNGTRAQLDGAQWCMTIGFDVVCFLALHAIAQSSSLNYMALLVLPVLMAGVLTQRLVALATVSVITLALLALAWWHGLVGYDLTSLLAQAGLAGCGFFVITLLVGVLASRLAREEIAARGSLDLARQHAQLNRLVIQEMQEGVLVVDRHGRVRTSNPAAKLLLMDEVLVAAEQLPTQLRTNEAWMPLVEAVEQAFMQGKWPEAGCDVPLELNPDNPPRVLRVRMRFTRRQAPTASEELCVLFLEDIRQVQARTRQEKLAAMGRVSAGIAHEIRNPLAAISQANSLLDEDATTPGQRQLTRMVADNVERLKRIVDEVMEVASSDASQSTGVMDVTFLTAAICSEWLRTSSMAVHEHTILKVDVPSEPMGIIFDEEHLRRVLINLLDNARRHAVKGPEAICVQLRAHEGMQVMLSVLSNGVPIAPDIERYLFEPFFSTRSRGTGLGLYICRELCARYGAAIDYRLRDETQANRNEFFLIMPRHTLAFYAELDLSLIG
jgi:two-component system, NtrC family, sensor histidine kinase PilS